MDQRMTKKLSPAVQDVYNAIALLTPREVIEFETTDFNRLLTVKRHEWYSSEEYKLQLRATAVKNEQRRQTAAEKETARAKWVLENLQPGQFVRMTGTRDGHGLRYVVSIQGNQVVCRKVSPCWQNKKETYEEKGYDLFMAFAARGGKTHYYVEHDVTTHTLGKVAELLVSVGDGCYETMKINP
jgi:hypothetical protein